MKGLFRVSNDNNIAAVDIREEATVIFPKEQGLANRDRPSFGTLEQLDPAATLIQTNDITLREASTAFIENRPPRWTEKNF